MRTRLTRRTRLSARVSQAERGQTMIQLALMLVVLLGLAALAIDLGSGYLERRRMQNAADAGALAGAYSLCKAEPVDVAKAKAVEYMKKNGVKAADIAAGDVTISGGEVSVVAKANVATSLAGPLGFTPLNVGATSAATCGAAKSACGLWPIAIALDDFPKDPCGVDKNKDIIIWGDGKIGECKIYEVPHPTCDCYKCEWKGKPISIVTTTSRGWLDFTGSVDPIYYDPYASNGCGAQEAKDRIDYGSIAPISVPYCVAGKRGVAASVLMAAGDHPNELVRIPLFDGTCEPTDNHCSGSDADGYHITAFGCVRMGVYEDKFGLKVRTDTPGIDPKIGDVKNAKVLIASPSCGDACMSACSSTDGTLPQPWELRAVSLTK